MTINIIQIQLWKTRRSKAIIPPHLIDLPDNGNPNMDLIRLICRWLDTDQMMLMTVGIVRVTEKIHIIRSRNTSMRTPGISLLQTTQVRRLHTLIPEGRFLVQSILQPLCIQTAARAVTLNHTVTTCDLTEVIEIMVIVVMKVTAME